MVVLIARDPGLQMTFTRQNRQPLSQRFQTRFDRLDRARFSIFNAVGRFNSPALQRTVEPVQTALDDMVERAYQICLRLTALDNNFAVQQLGVNFDDEIAKIQKNIDEASDVATRQEFNSTLQALQARKAQLKAVGVLLSRFETQLTGMSSAIDGVVTNVVGFQGRKPQQVEEKIPGLLEILKKQDDELQRFEAELEKSPAI